MFPSLFSASIRCELKQTPPESATPITTLRACGFQSTKEGQWIVESTPCGVRIDRSARQKPVCLASGVGVGDDPSFESPAASGGDASDALSTLAEPASQSIRHEAHNKGRGDEAQAPLLLLLSSSAVLLPVIALFPVL